MPPPLGAETVFLPTLASLVRVSAGGVGQLTPKTCAAFLRRFTAALGAEASQSRALVASAGPGPSVPGVAGEAPEAGESRSAAGGRAAAAGARERAGARGMVTVTVRTPLRAESRSIPSRRRCLRVGACCRPPARRATLAPARIRSACRQCGALSYRGVLCAPAELRSARLSRDRSRRPDRPQLGGNREAPLAEAPRPNRCGGCCVRARAACRADRSSGELLRARPRPRLRRVGVVLAPASTARGWSRDACSAGPRIRSKPDRGRPGNPPEGHRC
jgi:hypothetical protein